MSECLGGNIEGIRIEHDLYIVEHGSGTGYYIGNLEDESDTCCTLKDVLKLVRRLRNMDTIKIKTWYAQAYPTDDVGLTLDPAVTLQISTMPCKPANAYMPHLEAPRIASYGNGFLQD